MKTFTLHRIKKAVAVMLAAVLLLPVVLITKADASSANSVPVIAVNKGLSVNEDSSAVIISNIEIKTTDAEASLITYTLKAAPSKGVLYKNGKIMNVFKNNRFTQDDIDVSLISYMPVKEASGSDSFSFCVSDGENEVNGVFNITIIPRNDPPVLAANKDLSLKEGGKTVLSQEILRAEDPDQKPSELRFTLLSPPQHGIFYRNKTALKENGSFTQEDINSGLVSYAHDGGEASSDSFGFCVSDGAGGEIKKTTGSIKISIIDDAPTINKCDTLNIMENSSAASVNIKSSDDERQPLTYILTAVPEKGILKNTDRELSERDNFTQSDLNAGRITYTPQAGLIGGDSFKFTVTDGTTGTDGTFGIYITPLNRAPVITSGKNASCAGTAKSSSVVYTAKASDANGDKITWRISGADSALMDININTGEIKFINPPLYFKPLDSDNNNIYEINVIASDGRLSSEMPVKITVERFLSALTEDASGNAENGAAKAYINGEAFDAGIISFEKKEGGRREAKVLLDTEKLKSELDGQPSAPIITVHVSGEAAAVSVVFEGDAVKAMEAREAVLELETGFAAYTLPVSKINIGEIAGKLETEASDITIALKIAQQDDETAAVIESAAAEGGFDAVLPAVEFSIECVSGKDGKAYDAESFNAFIERLIAVPDEIDPNDITTGVTVKPDGTAYPVPTQLITIGGKNYVKLSSFTNSTYTLVTHRVEFKDVKNHWARDIINDMGSRMIFSGSSDGKFEPDRHMTRAEFAAVIVRALGFSPKTGKSSFSDVPADEWYSGYLETAVDCGLLYGYGDGTIGAFELITREQALTMMARAMKLAGLTVKLDSNAISQIMTLYSDGFSTSRYAGESVAACVYFGLITGDEDGRLRPKAFISRAEVAVILNRLLIKADLI
jgi:hypothetical protein